MLFQGFAVGEGVAYAGAEGDVSVMDRVEGYEPHLLDIGLAILGKIRLVAEDVEDFGNDIVAGFRFI